MAFIENIGAFIRWVLKGCKTKLHNELTKEKIFINILVGYLFIFLVIALLFIFNIIK